MKDLLLFTVVQYDIKGTAQCHNELFRFTECMPATHSITRDIVYPKSTLYLKRNLIELFHHRQIAAAVSHLGKLYDCRLVHINLTNNNNDYRVH